MLPEKWYVFYSNWKEFDIIKKHYSKSWGYVEQSPEAPVFGYCNIGDKYNHWIMDGSGVGSLNDYKNQGAVEITFEDFEKYVLNKTPKTKEDMSYLIKVLERCNIK